MYCITLCPGRQQNWASLCPPRIRAEPYAELGEVTSREGVQPPQEL